MVRTDTERSRVMNSRRLWLLALLVFSATLIPSAGALDQATADLITKTIEQLDLALEQVVYAHVRFPIEDLKSHAHVALNLLEGRRGSDYDPSYSDPGDGIGVVNYVQRIRQAPEIQRAPEETRVVLENALDNVSLYLEQAMNHTLTALKQTQLTPAQGEMRQVLAFLSAAKGRENELTAAGGLLALKTRLGEQGGSPQNSQK
ncbi:MAG: hypothetical protein A2Z21_03950 [Candidatus Fraserbacteria bacterium RBG_16_55_9]|uniref:Imelysin-like domain-containing protein n=1 Tax=Fraserbacteria sp. (strain RBG_16_55_9) TaxID=1817864 RepID=A0A1F5V036_FRAXR|nr:MAG: hypothetical protein A2Z21_03950 [Candidatus Fraserbacteria bacterium RBG_16_55_9]